MYCKKQGNTPPVTKSGCVYEESYAFQDYLFLKYSVGNIPSESLEEITQEEYEANRPVMPAPAPEPLSTTEQAIMQTAINTEYMMSLMEVKG